MWIMTKHGMLSIVEHYDHENVMVVRSRDRKALDHYFPGGDKPVETTYTDYRWRLFLSRDEVAGFFAGLIDEIRYPNFKNAVEDDELHAAYSCTWVCMRRYQQRVNPPTMDDTQYDLGFKEPAAPWSDEECEPEAVYHPGWPSRRPN
jgi:hypothetical protein